MDLLKLKDSDYIEIENQKYRILNKIKFIEKSSYWIEYKLQNLENSKIYYLNVELSLLTTLYTVLNEKNITLDLEINYKGEQYQIYEKGFGKVETYSGLTDVALKDMVEYYEYKSKTDNKKTLSIEKWKNQIEVSIGKEIKNSNIKLLKQN